MTPTFTGFTTVIKNTIITNIKLICAIFAAKMTATFAHVPAVVKVTVIAVVAIANALLRPSHY